MIPKFEFYLPVRIKFSIGSLDSTGRECKRFGAQKVLIVCDSGLIDTNSYNRVLESLKKADIKVEIFSEFTPEPDDEIIEKGLDVLKSNNCDSLIGFGGGSGMDVARGIAIAATIEGSIHDYKGFNTLKKPVLPFITIPTTAGTASEVSSTIVLYSKAEKSKYVIVSPFAYARTAILDPEVLLTLPKSVAATSGMDAIVHAVEAYISNRSSPLSEMYGVKSLSMLTKSIRHFVLDRSNSEAGAEMMLGSMFAGIAMAQAGLGVIHGLANTLGGRFHAPHGLACALLLCDSLELMVDDTKAKYAIISRIMDSALSSATDEVAANNLPVLFRKLLDDLGIKSGIRQLGIAESDFSSIADEAMASGQAAFSPRKIGHSDMIEILQRAL